MSHEKGFYEKKSWGSVAIDEGRDLPTLKLHRLLDVLPEKGKVLEIGSGSGRILASVKTRKPELSLTGVDISKKQVKIAKRDNPGIEFKVGDAENMPFKAGTFDAVFFLDVIEHVKNPDRLLKEASRVLKKGGMFHGMSPCEGHGVYMISNSILGWHIKERTAGHIQMFTRKGLAGKVKSSGLKIMRRQYSYHLLGSLMDYVMFALLLNDKIAKVFWSRNKYYKNTKTKQTFTSRILNGILTLTNGIAYYESRILGNVPLFSTAIHITASKK